MQCNRFRPFAPRLALGTLLVTGLVSASFACTNGGDPASDNDAGSQPETAQPDAAQPEVGEPDAAQPEATEPDATEPDVTEPETAEPETTEPDAAQPETAEPEAPTDGGAPEPETNAPETNEPDAPADAGPVEIDSGPVVVEPQPQTFSLDSDNATLWVQVWRDPDAFGAGLAHDHVIRADSLSGSLTLNPADLTDCSVSVTVQVAGLQVDEPFMREKVGLTGAVGASDRSTIKGHMTAENQLNALSHPTITYVADACEESEGGLTAVGTLTLRGTSRPKRWPMTFTLDDGLLVADGEVEITHAEFGFQPYSAFLGAVRNREDMQIHFEIDATAD